jgi:Uncharacterized protein conserved in bacteria (DUF2188)
MTALAKSGENVTRHSTHPGNPGLKEDRSARVRHRFENKAEATRGGALRKVLGQAGGSVKIQNKNGRLQEERTYPKSKDPTRSPG